MILRQLQLLAIAAGTLTQIAISQPIFAQDSPLVGNWREVEKSPQGGSSVFILTFKSNGTFTGQNSMSGARVGDGGSSITEWYGTYRMTGRNSFVQTVKELRTGLGENWDYCPPRKQSNFNSACDLVEKHIISGVGQIGSPGQVSFKIDRSTQQLIVGGDKFRKVR